MKDSDETPPIRGLDDLEARKTGNLPPVHLWQPDNCRDIDMRIDRDGNWYYMGSLIGRERMVLLFSSILRRDHDDRYYLVTPVEKCGIVVDDAPFVATGIGVSGNGPGQMICFTTNVGDEVCADENHPLRFAASQEPGVFVPYVTIRHRLEARINRAVFYDLIACGGRHTNDGGDWFGVWSGDRFWPIALAAEIDAA